MHSHFSWSLYYSKGDQKYIIIRKDCENRYAGNKV